MVIGEAAAMGTSKFEASIRRLEIQAEASSQVLTKLMALTALEHPLGDWVFKFLSDSPASLDDSDPLLNKAVVREIKKRVAEAKTFVSELRSEK
jgi:hypothetical protein